MADSTDVSIILEASGDIETPIKLYYRVETDEGQPSSKDEDNWECLKSLLNWKDTIAVLNSMQDLPVGERRLIDYVRYDGIYLWQYIQGFIWQDVYFATEILRLLDQLESRTQSKRISFELKAPVSLRPLFLKILNQFCKHYAIVLIAASREPEEESSLYLRVKHKWRDTKAYVWTYAMFRGVKHLCSWDHFKVKPSLVKVDREPRLEKKILLMTYGLYWADCPGNPQNQYDQQISPLLPALRKQGWQAFTILDCFYPLRVDLEERTEKSGAGVQWQDYWAYKEDCVWRKCKQESYFLKMLRGLRCDHSFRQAFTFLGVPMMPILEDVLEHIFVHRLPRVMDMLDTADIILDQEQPEAIIATSEYSIFQSSLMMKAQLRGIPSVGLIHASVFNNHFSYMHRRITRDPKAAGIYIPHKTCVWGEHIKATLCQEGEYPEDAVAVTGHWRYDFIFDKNAWSQKTLRKRFEVDDASTLVLLATSGQNLEEYMRAFLEVICAKPGCIPLIKLHHYDYPAWMKDLFDEFGLTKKNSYTGQLIDALYACDLMIGPWSTVHAEAALLNKPSILINFQQVPMFAGPYVEEGLTPEVTNTTELSTVVDKVLYDEGMKTTLQIARNQFVENFFYKKDGCAGDRVAQVVSSLVSDRE